MSFQAAPPEDFMKTALKHTGDLKLLVITGSPGCGKSTFCHELEKLGLPVISSDVIVARLYAASGEATSWLERRFGRALLQTDGAIDKAALFDRLQSSPDFRREFEALVHSLVLDEILKFAAAQKKLGRPFAVVEIPLYFECGMRGMLRQHPFVIGVQCPQAERWRRIRENRAWTDSKIRTLEEWQWREERKMAACDVVVSNMGSAKELSEQAARILANLNGQKQIENEKTKTRLYSICGQDAG